MKKRTKIILIALALVVGLVFTFAKINRISPLSWGHKEVNQPMFSNLAINGYDPVAYFKENSAIEGKDAHSYQWKNANWNFATEENRNAFIEDPEKYAPQYGGYCAFAVSKGFTANSDPGSFEIVDNKLYLFADGGVAGDWMAKLEENLKKCNESWK